MGGDALRPMNILPAFSGSPLGLLALFCATSSSLWYLSLSLESILTQALIPIFLPSSQYIGLLIAYSTRRSNPCAMKICINICKHVEDYLVLLAIFASNTYFCNRNFRTLAWVNNVIGLHGS